MIVPFKIPDQQEKYDLENYYARLNDGGMTLDVVHRKYMAPLDNNNLTNAWWRIAASIANVEVDDQDYWANEFMNILIDFKFMPSGRVFHAAGREDVGRRPTLSSCYVQGFESRIKPDVNPVIAEFVRLVADVLWEPEMAYLYIKDKYEGKDVIVKTSDSPTSSQYSNAGSHGPQLKAIRAAIDKNQVSELIEDACVYPSDSVEAAYDWLKASALTYRIGGGVGVNVGVFRPSAERVNSSINKAPGATWLMNLMSESTATISQNGRRGSLMITCPIWHPDIRTFIRIKEIKGKITDQDGKFFKYYQDVEYANISVLVTDAFMEAVRDNDNFNLKWRGKVYDAVNARELWEEIIDHAHRFAEPGIIFWDEAVANNNVEHLSFPLIATNPCGEAPMANNDACNLSPINLSKFVYNKRFQFDEFTKVIRTAVRFMDDVIDYNMNNHSSDAIKQVASQTRRIGLGQLGLADMFIRLGIRYDSNEAIQLVDDIMQTYRNTAYQASIDLARQRGPFPAFKWEGYAKSKFVQSLPVNLQNQIKEHGIRNANLLSMAPTGTVSVAAMTSSGIEPVFATSYSRRVRQDGDVDDFKTYKVVHPVIKELFGGDENLPDCVVTAHQIDPEFRIKLQSVVQKYTDAAISSTINLPRDTTVEQVANIYEMAWKQNLKGITVYREGSREGILITTGNKAKAEKAEAREGSPVPAETSNDFRKRKPADRPKRLYGYTEKVRTGQGNMLVTINEDSEGHLFELIARLGKSGGDETAVVESLSRVISIALRAGVDPWELMDQLKDQGGKDQVFHQFEGAERGSLVKSVPDGIGKMLENYLRARQGDQSDGQAAKDNTTDPEGVRCPDCGDTTGYILEDGCGHCLSCGYSKCEG